MRLREVPLDCPEVAKGRYVVIVSVVQPLFTEVCINQIVLFRGKAALFQ